tara:strand:- start:946 stop:1860 length:915 start_codon:yes stop_codon:yes gene_type:complete
MDMLVEKMTKDLKKAGKTLSKDEARFLVDAYYRTQEQRIRYDAQIRALTKAEEPHDLLSWFSNQSRVLEEALKKPLDEWSFTTPEGRWCREHVCGVAGIITSGLMAHIDIERVMYAGQIWSYAGLNPSQEWKKGQKRPWNAELKKLCFKIGESFVKTQSKESDFYGKLFVKKKAELWEKNLKGEFADAAAAKSVGKSTQAYKWYNGQVSAAWARGILKAGKNWPVSAKTVKTRGTPMLPPAHIHSRARRWVVKMFLSHLFEVMYISHHGEEPPIPYILTQANHNKRVYPPGYSQWLAEEGIALE